MDNSSDRRRGCGVVMMMDEGVEGIEDLYAFPVGSSSL
jgi:hypothetical protein